MAAPVVPTVMAKTVAAPFDVTPFVHPDLRAAAEQLKAFRTGGDITGASLEGARKGQSAYVLPPLEAPAYREAIIPGPRGNPNLRVFVVNEGDKGMPRAAILHMHGGGFILGAAETELNEIQKTAAELDCVIVTVDYRLAPETRFPGSLEDNYAALKWLYAHADELGVDRSRIAVMGGSAGGGHAAMLAIAARNRGEVPICFQALTYPMLDDRTGSTVQKPPQMGALIWTPGSNRFGWTSLLGVPAGSRKVPPGSVPARETNLTGLPPTLIGVGTIDLFFDEDVEYARRLAGAGVLVELAVAPGCFHGFTRFETAPVTQRYNKHFMGALRAGLSIEQ
ncbi:MAG: alpha/beta hydrolase [Novosphingobium sp.]|nr:alpha/beta hydrolase [Novosphingobium sp.]